MAAAYPNGLNFDDVFPYNKFEEVTRDGQAMIKIPKVYVKAGYTSPTAEMPEKYGWWISEFPQEGFHCHPAFMLNGEELDYFLLGKYEASNDGASKAQSLSGKTPWVNITTPNAIAACLRRNTGVAGSEQYGWHLESIYEYQLISMLMLIELGTPDVQTVIGSGNINGSGVVATGSTNAKWRGICEHWANAWEICDGFKTGASGQALIWDKNGNQTYVDTGKIVADKGFARGKGTDYDFADVFVPVDDGKGSTYSGSTADGVWTAANCVLYLGGSWAYGARDGAFTFYSYRAASYSYSDIGFRLAKYDI